MTVALSGKKIASQLEQKFAGSVVESTEDSLLVNSKSLLDLTSFLKSSSEFDFNYLSSITAVDYLDYFEVIYQLTSMNHNHSLTLKTRCQEREKPVLLSVTGLWRGADYQEREIHDLFGIYFEGHPNMKPLVLWEGFKGNPLRRDYL